jgi:Tfp pilus assembly protein PilX
MQAIVLTVVIVMGVFSLGWLRWRLRTQRRRAALDAYAEREMSRAAAFHKH